MRYVLAFLALLLLALPAQAQTPKTKAALNTEITTNFPDNTTGLITPAILRTTTSDFVASWVDYLTCTTTGGIVYWNASAVPTCLVAGANGSVLTLAAGIPSWSASPSGWPSGGGPSSGTSGGIPYFNAATTVLSSGVLSANNPILGGGAGGAPISGSRSGNTTVFATATGTLTNGHCVSIDANGNFVDAGGACTTGGGGGTVTAGLTNQLAYYATNGTVVSGLATANNGTLITSAGGVPSISSTLPTAVQANITQTGTLTGGATGSGFTVALGTSTITGVLPGTNGGTGVANTGFTITLGGNFTTSGAFNTTITSTGTTNATLPAGTHTLAGLDVAQTFTALNQFTNLKLSTGVIYPVSDSTTAIQIAKADATTVVVDVDTSNRRVGINRTPGAFDLDVNNNANIGGTLTFGTGTITALTDVATPVGANDYFLFWSASANGIRKCTLTACASSAAAGVTSVNALSGALTLAVGPGLSVASAVTTVTVSLATTQTTYYLATTGNDSNTCLVGSPCLTLAHVCSVASGVAVGGTIIINIANGTYAGNCNLFYYNRVTIIGNVATPASVVIQLTGSDYGFWAQDHVILSLSGVTIQSSGSGSVGITARQYSIVDFDNIVFGALASGIGVSATESAKMNCGASNSITGNAAVFVSATGSSIVLMPCTVTIATARAFTQYFSITTGAYIDATSGSFTGAGVAGSTGLQYVITGGTYTPTMGTPAGTGFLDLRAPQSQTVGILDSSALFYVTFAATSSTTMTANRTLTVDMVNAARTLKLGANLTLATDPGAVTGALKSNGTGTFAQAACSDLSDAAGTCTSGIFRVVSTSVNFNSGNTDTAFTITLPAGFTRYNINGIFISGASASLSTATAGVFTSTGGGGTTVVANTAVTVTTGSENTVNNVQLLSASASTSFNAGTLYFRVGTPQGSAATATVSMYIRPLS